ncbi:MAG: alginate export family protein [Candidatus Omnitrophota bacterium]
MSKRLILALVAVGAIGLIIGPAFAAVQNIKVSGDLEVMPLSRTAFDLKGEGENSGYAHESLILSFLRLRVDADLTDNVSTTVRLLNERAWGEEATTSATVVSTDAAVDLAYVTLKEFLYSPLTLTIGRQELHMGSEMIVGDPDTNNAVAAIDTAARGIRTQPDLSKRKAFDSIRATLNSPMDLPLVIDAIYAKINEATTTEGTTRDDETLLGLAGTYELKDMWDSMLESYFYQRIRGQDNIEVVPQEKTEATNVFGGRVVSKPIENLVVSLEGAIQKGDYYESTNNITVDRDAWAIEAGANYTWVKARYTPSLTALYANFSGEGKNFNALSDSNYNGWDNMYENQSYGDIANALLGSSNISLVGLILNARPTEDIGAKLAYYQYWWNKRYVQDDTIVNTAHTSSANLVMNREREVGREIDASLTYDYTEDVQFGLTGGVFIPGKSFTNKNNTNATQVLGSMLVKF